MGVFFLELLLYYKLSQEFSSVYIIHQILIQHILVFSFLLEKSIMDGVYVIFILVEHHLSFFFYFYILEELYFMVHIFIIQILGFLAFLFSSFPSSVEWLCGGYCVYSPTLKRFFLFHFILPFLLCGFVILHLFYLHFHSSNNPLRLNTNNKIPFFPFIFLKDFSSHSNSLSIFSSNSFWDLFSLTSR